MKNAVLFILISALAFTACKKAAESTPSKGTSSNTDFDHLYHTLLSTSGYSEETTMDAEVHAYSFDVSAPRSITKVGYQSLPGFNTTPYLIEIYDSTTAALLYSGYHTFSYTATSYDAIPPVAVAPGHNYVVRRIQTNWAGDIGNTIGKLAIHRTANDVIPIPFPQSYGNLIVTGSVFYGTGGPIYNYELPYIDLVFAP